MAAEVLLAGATATVVLFVISAAMSLLLASTLLCGVLSRSRVARCASRAVVNTSRCVPTSIFVLFTGLGVMRALPSLELPVVFPGTSPLFQTLAWAVAGALALGSAGHLTEILLAARQSLGHARLQQILSLGLAFRRRACLTCREAAPAAIPAIAARLVHHLHNTAFAALFPVAELFGSVQSHANRSFRVLECVAYGALLYVALSALIWAAFRALEAALRPPVRRVAEAVSSGRR